MADGAPLVDVERSLLGAVLVDPDQFDAVRAAGLDARLFYREAHRLIWAAFVEVRATGAVPDLLTTARALGPRLEAVGGVLYLSELTNGVPRAVNVAAYVGMLSENLRDREYLAALESAATAIRARGATSDVLGPLVAVLQGHDAGPPGFAHEHRVFSEMTTERARRVARRRLDAEERGRIAWPEIVTLSERLARPRAPKRWRIRDWHPWGARTMTTAVAKAGKTTLTGNRIRSCVDGDKFLGVAHVTPITGTYVLLNTEMSADQTDDWLADQGIRDQARVIPITLKGAAASFNIIDPVCRAEWAARFREIGGSFLDQDGLRPILDAIGLDEHKDAGRFLVAFDALLDEAVITEGNITHHMGHGQERARGDSRLRDWPDVEIRLVRESDESRSPRFISAYGRDVDIQESRLEYDPVTRRLSLAGGSRRDAASRSALDDIIGMLVASAVPMTGRAITRQMLEETSHSKASIEQALKLGRRPGAGLASITGPKNSIVYSASVPVSRSVPSASQDASVPVSQCPIGHGTLDTQLGGGCVEV